MATDVRLTQDVVEAFVDGDGGVNLTTEAAEVFTLQHPDTRITAAVVEVFTPGAPPVQITAASVEPFHYHTNAPIALTSVAIEVWYVPRIAIPNIVDSIWQLHRFDMKTRREGRA